VVGNDRGLKMNELILGKIKKLLALSLSDNPNEAALAAQKAVELMNTYGVIEADLDDNPFIEKKIETEYNRLPTWVTELWSQLGYASGCYVVYSHVKQWRGKKAYFRLAGRKADVEIMCYMAEFFEAEINKRIKIAKAFFKNSRKEFNSYKEGLAVGIAIQIKESQKTFFEHHKSEGRSLVPIDTKAVEAEEWFLALNGVNPKIVDNQQTGSYFFAGIRDAKDISINKGINGGSDFIALSHFGS